MDPYELLRQALPIIEASYPRGTRSSKGPRELWLEAYNQLPGAELSGRDLKVLADPHRRLREGKAPEQSIKRLLKEKYLVEVHHVGGRTGTYNSIRRTAKGLAALRLRGKA